MARPGLDRNVKFRDLVRTLRLPRPYVLGLLEMMWSVAHESGNPVLGCSRQVESAAEWPGEDNAFFESVKKCGFIDQRPDGRWEIHDYWDHAPEYVPGRAQKEREREKEKTCQMCKVTFHSSEIHAKFCCQSCRQSHFRALRAVTEPCVAVTEPCVAVTEPCVNVTPRNGPPAPAPLTNTNSSSSSSMFPAREEDEEFLKPLPEEFQEAWNRSGLRECRHMTGKRLFEFQERIKYRQWCENWQESLAKAASSPFCQGTGRKAGVADCDWFLKPATVFEIMEGKHLKCYGVPTASQSPEQYRADREAKTKAARAQAARERAEANGCAHERQKT